jgi:tetratricopeptide (TPR) repeat protein
MVPFTDEEFQTLLTEALAGNQKSGDKLHVGLDWGRLTAAQQVEFKSRIQKAIGDDETSPKNIYAAVLLASSLPRFSPRRIKLCEWAVSWGYSHAMARLGFVRAGEGKRDEACSLFNAALKVRPDEPLALQGLAYQHYYYDYGSCTRRSDVTAAVEYIKQLEAMDYPWGVAAFVMLYTTGILDDPTGTERNRLCDKARTLGFTEEEIAFFREVKKSNVEQTPTTLSIKPLLDEEGHVSNMAIMDPTSDSLEEKAHAVLLDVYNIVINCFIWGESESESPAVIRAIRKCFQTNPLQLKHATDLEKLKELLTLARNDADLPLRVVGKFLTNVFGISKQKIADSLCEKIAAIRIEGDSILNTEGLFEFTSRFTQKEQKSLVGDTRLLPGSLPTTEEVSFSTVYKAPLNFRPPAAIAPVVKMQHQATSHALLYPL